MTSLRILKLGGNNFQVVPEAVTQLSSLKELDLSSCKVRQLPESFSNMESLRKLNLSSSNIEDVPEAAMKLSSLEELDMSECKIKKLPEKLSLVDSGADEGLSPLPVTALDEDSDLSDVERKRYCDEKSPADIIIRPDPVRQKYSESSLQQ
ncbi:uncharacterized protein [Watersipora subatra]|uniref:uncharacterized protein n=1 Tax=Watersipora subatra TaxID=2589382 RepID=UPI00355B0F3C